MKSAIKAAEFKDKTTAINPLWQTELVARARLRLTYLKITGWGWYYLSTVLDEFASRPLRILALHRGLETVQHHACR